MKQQSFMTRYIPSLVQLCAVLFAVVLPIIFATPVSAGQSSVPETVTLKQQENNRDIVRRAFDAWVAGESVFGQILAEDVVWTIHGSDPVAGTYTNRQVFVEQAATPLLSRLVTPVKPVVHAIWADNDVVIIRFDGSATTTGGTLYENQFVWIFQMQDGLVVEAEAFLDLAAYREVVENNPVKTE